MKRGRSVRADELYLWNRIARTTDPLQKAAKADIVLPPEQPDVTHVPKSFVDEFPARRPSKPAPGVSVERAPSLPARLAEAPVQMDRKRFNQMSKGRLRPEGRIDLHGMTLDRAHGALTRFIMTQHAAGKRLVLVITGKGKPVDDGGPVPIRQGALRHQVPQWLTVAPLSAVVLQVTQAHRKHGGSGAYYVYLRRAR